MEAGSLCRWRLWRLEMDGAVDWVRGWGDAAGFYMGPANWGDGAIALLVAAGRRVNMELEIFSANRVVAMVNWLADAASMFRSSPRRQRERHDVTEQREEKQKTCGEAVHATFQDSGGVVGSARAGVGGLCCLRIA